MGAAGSPPSSFETFGSPLPILCLQPAPAQQRSATSGCCSERHKVLNGSAQTPRAENQPC